MTGLARIFLTLATLAALMGMVWGIQMAASHDHSLAPGHAHLNLLGWVSFAIFGFYYHLVPEAAQGLLPRVHLVLAVAGVVILVPGIALAINDVSEVPAQIGSVLTLASMATFAAVVVRSPALRKVRA